MRPRLSLELAVVYVLSGSLHPGPDEALPFHERFPTAARLSDWKLQTELESVIHAAFDDVGSAFVDVDVPRIASPTRALGRVTVWIRPGSGLVYEVEVRRSWGRWSVARKDHVDLRSFCFLDRSIEVGRVMLERFGCTHCHADPAVPPLLAEETARPGPSLRGFFGSERPLADGTTVVADEEYFRRVLLDVDRVRAAGWAPTMPTYVGFVSRSEIAAMVDYLRSSSD